MNAASFLVCTSFFPTEVRLPHQIGMLKAISEWPVASVRVVLMTFADNDVIEKVSKVFEIFNSSILSIEFYKVNKYDDGYMLTWEHKDLIKSRFLAISSRYTHFLYTEDDLQISWRNVAYWIKFREELDFSRLLPGMLRYEIARGDIWATDVSEPQKLDGRCSIHRSGLRFVNVWPPYQALLLLDRQLAEEHIQSRSFDFENSKYYGHYGTPERASMGPTWENAPLEMGFSSRYVIPVGSDNLPHFDCMVHHLPNTYASSQDVARTLCGTLRIKDLFY